MKKKECITSFLFFFEFISGMLKMNWLPLRLFLFSIFFVSLSVFATESCDYFVNEVNSLKPEDTQAFFKGKIDYSKAYIEVPFLEKMGLYDKKVPENRYFLII